MQTFFDKKLLRLNKLKSNIHLELSKLLKLYPNLINEEFLNHSFSLIDLELTKNFKLITCFIEVYNSNDEGIKCLELFNKHTKRIRFLLTKTLELKFSPEIRFEKFKNYTPSQDVNRILDLLSHNRRKTEQ
jgi:ribosome-binding factor A